MQDLHTADDLYHAIGEAWDNIPMETIKID